MKLRPYQQDAVNKAIAWMRRSVMPGLLELATGSGKSHIVAAAASWVYGETGKRVLCLQPSRELTEQNHSKYLSTGNPASIFSASAGRKCMRHHVIYGTPGTVKNSLSRFGDQFGAVIIDEAHGITPSIKMIVDHIRSKNPLIRVIGLSATPYRTQSGFIYQYDVSGSFVPEDQARDPWFNTLLYRIQTRELIDMGYLTPAHADPDHAESYAAGSLEVNSRGQFDSADVERVFEGRGRLTAEIVADIVHHARGRMGVMIFAATVQHAQEVMESLPPDISAIVTGATPKGERSGIIDNFKAQKIKYLVNVSVLTVGFDAPHCDLIAIMRATESPGLLQQIIGRGLRLHPDKHDCLVLDYAENIERHDLHDDLFSPRIRVKGAPGESEPVNVKCPECGFRNEFSPRKNDECFEYSEDGYFLDLNGQPIETDHGPMPSHHGRRCTGQVSAGMGLYERCEYRWTSKECPECQADNDIAARYCCACKAEIIDPNEKLRRDFIRVKKDPYAISTDAVLSWSAHPHTSRRGGDCVMCKYTTEYRSFEIYYSPEARHPNAVRAWESLSRAVFRGHLAPNAKMFLDHIDKGSAPITITYRRQKNSQFFEAIDHNRPEDKLPS